MFKRLFGIGSARPAVKPGKPSSAATSAPVRAKGQKTAPASGAGAKSPASAKPRTVSPDRPRAAPKVGPSSDEARPLAPRPSGPKAAAASDEEVAQALAYSGSVLTAPGGQIQTTESQRLVAAALDNGVLLVSKYKPLSPETAAVRSLLQMNRIEIRRELLVDLDVIRKVYEAAASRGQHIGQNRAVQAERQREFMNLVRRAADIGASDIHIIVRRYEAVIRVRADGVMAKIGDIPANTASELLAAAWAMADSSDASYKPYEPQGARISDVNSQLPEGVQSIRLQFNPLSNGGRYMVARLLYAQAIATGTDIDELGYSQSHIRLIKRMRRSPIGINIISGPTGSGKSTTLQRSLSALMEEKRGQVNVITIEDPPEYVISGATQLPVTNAATEDERGEAFRKAITASLRSDPDVIMIGEIRDQPSAALAFTAAMTGHQLWASLHANDALSIIDRLRDMNIEEYKLTDHSLVTGLIGQRLVRTLCPHCKIPLDQADGLSSDVAENARAIARASGAQIFVANETGCSACRNGYTGRTVVAECIIPDQKFMDIVREHNKSAALAYWLNEMDGLTLLEHAVQKMVEGIVDPRDVEDRVGLLSDVDRSRLSKVLAMTSGPQAIEAM